MINIYLFIELLRAANAADTAEHLRGLSLAKMAWCRPMLSQ
jgi:hypothetical protein